jgi:IS5 family transposase
MSIAATSTFVLSIDSLHGNPYDGHTLAKTINNTEQNTNVPVNKVSVDTGYKGNDFNKKQKIYMTRSKRKELSPDDKFLMKRRNSIEPIFGHLKKYFNMGINYLHGKIGDILNSIRAAIGFNFKKIYRELILQT